MDEAANYNDGISVLLNQRDHQGTKETGLDNLRRQGVEKLL